MKKENKITLILGLIYPLTFYVFWYLAKFNILEWQSSYDKAGTLLLLLSEPWSSVIYDFNVVIFLSKHFGTIFHDYLLSALVCLAFVINVFVLKIIGKWCYGKIRNT